MGKICMRTFSVLCILCVHAVIPVSSRSRKKRAQEYKAKENILGNACADLACEKLFQTPYNAQTARCDGPHVSFFQVGCRSSVRYLQNSWRPHPTEVDSHRFRVLPPPGRCRCRCGSRTHHSRYWYSGLRRARIWAKSADERVAAAAMAKRVM